MGDQNLYLKSINLQAIPIIWEEDAEVVDTKKKRKVVTRKKKGDIDMLGGGPANQKKAKRTSQPTSEIPIPHVKIVEDYDESDSWEQPNDYIRYEGTMSESPNYLVEYDLDDEDEEFLQDMNAKEEVLDENKFEFIVDLLERETFYNDHQVPTLDQAQHILQLPTEILQEIYKYWIEKREQTGPLVHRYSILRPDTPIDYTVFRKRSPYVKSTIRRDDLPSYKKMLKLRLQMEHARMLLETMIKREKAKREHTETLNEIIDLQLQAAWPKKESKSKAKARTNSSRNKKTKSDVEESSSRSSRSRDSDSDGPSSKKHKAIDASPPSSKAKAKATLLNTIHTSRLKHIL